MLKKLAKILMWIGIVLLTIILIAYLVIRIKFPPQKLKRLAIAELETAINRKVKIGETWFNPIKGLTINDVVIYQHSPHDTSVIDTTSFFQSQKIHLKYRFLSLLKREIEINNILIDQLQVYITQDQNRRWNFDDLIAADTTTAIETAPPDTGVGELRLPLTLKLKNFSLNNFTPCLSITKTDIIYKIKTGGISVQVDDLFIPRKSYDELKQKARAKVKISSEPKPWEFTLEIISSSEKISFSTELQLDVGIDLTGLDKINGLGNIALTNALLERTKSKELQPQQYRFPLPQLTSISFDLSTNAIQETLELKKFATLLGEETIFDIKGSITDFSKQPIIDLEVIKSEINLKSLVSSFSGLLQDSFEEELKNLSLKGIASFNGTKITGNPLSEKNDDALRFKLLFSVNDFSAKYIQPDTRLNNLILKSDVSGIYNLNGLQKSDISVKLLADTLSVVVDTLNFAFKGLKLDFNTTLNPEFMPDSAVMIFRVDNFFDVPLNLGLNFKTKDGFNKYKANGVFSFNQLPLRELSGSTMEGVIDFGLDFHSESLDQIDVDLKLASDLIELQTETEPLIFYPMDILGNATLATDTSFMNFYLKQFNMKINDFASGIIHGNLFLGKQQEFNLFVDNFNLNHEKMMAILPAQLIEEYESLKISGGTDLTSEVSIIINKDQEPIINANGNVSVNAGIEYPDQFFTLKRLASELDFETYGTSGKFILRANLDSLIVEGVQDEPLRNISAFASGKFPDLETIKLDTSTILIPDLMTRVLLTAKIDNISTNMQAKFTSQSCLDTEEDSVSLLNILKLAGKIDQKTTVSLSDNIAEITGNVFIDNVSLNYDNIAQFDSITGKIFINQKFDIENEKIIENPLQQSFIAEAGSYYYDLLRPYYQQSREQFSNLQIKKIKALDYAITDINFDLFILNERIEIPRLSLKAYDGNMSGLIYANLHEGKPDQIEWKIKANVSRLNSAKLIPTRKVKTKGSDLNMNLELSGSGIDPASQLDVEGYLYVTKIGPQFTDNVLKSLDPKGIDKSIQDTRKLLNWGYKPKLISFEIKHGNLYPTIHLVKGKFLTKLIPLNLSGGKIELARIPVKFFLTNMMAETE